MKTMRNNQQINQRRAGCLIPKRFASSSQDGPPTLSTIRFFQKGKDRMNAQIEELKNNTTVHGELSAEARACFERVGLEKCEVFWCASWGVEATHPNPSGFLSDYAYRIKADYQPGPEIEWCKVKRGLGDYGRLGFRYKADYHSLSSAVDFPEFHGCKYANGRVITELRARWDFPEVNKKPAEGPIEVGFVKGRV